ncbi:3-oxo-5-alpha-steroid 4-dehydrogenase-domain-containing protein [Annulohypoxylon maeteangense]|uniref:3-oxo-5-alpha-steroid 4-dehydrogenase-domain-containing protein n=1 Tax=Annulohypoxylon maeteangense TaxID=1927788 RepID=UPI002007C5A8|nr:3-oxo-5-alpha-steroid 4-dehydrogenase-domain-containing protein [Annulohypoxylon maeteangense]KAI0882565.1 3-oxo-5-alpha-steroid 4-dehydrogenase-domain-containing protein [Annulohypoxylon maeteangense]
MAGLTLKVTNRSRKGLKGLPSTIEVPEDATVDDAKKIVARAANVSDHYRIGIFDPVSKKTIKDRNSLLKSHAEVVKRGELLVKDLGLQIGWRLVYVIEYLGPLLFHPLFLSVRHTLYPAVYPYLKTYLPYTARADPSLSFAQQAAFGMVMAHFVKRELETMFLHKFSAATMPFAYIFRNSVFYWAMAGFLGALEIYAPFSPAAVAPDAPSPLTYFGFFLFAVGEILNFDVHWYLAHLRKPGETDRKIPRGHGFGIVTCPNYMYEIIAWIGIIIVTRSPSLFAFICVGSYYMYTWGWGKEKTYRKQFGDKYKKKRSVMLPGLL